MQSRERVAAPQGSRLPKRLSSWYEKLLPEQVGAANFTFDQLKDGGGVALFSQQRTGKTYITSAVLERLHGERAIKLALVVVPLVSVEPVWLPALSTLPGRLLRDIQELREASGPATLLIHWEAFAKHAKRLAKLPWDIVIIDESQRLKARNSLSSRSGRRLRHVTRRLALSGTPIDDSQIDVWAQMRFVDHEVFGEDWLDFAEVYCEKAGFMGKQWVFRKDMHDQFLRALKNHIYRLTTSFFNPKPVHIIPVPVVMFGSQEKIYREMDEHNIIRVPGGKIVAPLPITRDRKKSQITGGWVIDDDQVVRLGYAKERKLQVILNRIKRYPVVIFCEFLHEIDAISLSLKKAGMTVAVVSGRTKKTRSQVLKNFDAGKYDILLCQVRTGSISIDLTRSNNLVLYSFNHSYIDFEQILFRLQGMNQKHEVYAYFLYCVGTIDEEKVDAIERKKSTASMVMSYFERRSAMAKKTPAKTEEPKGFGVNDLAKLAKLEPATVRVKLRELKIKKSGRGYNWPNKAALAAVAKKLAA